eukprot:scpid46897/ scgid29644/ Mitochondrial intermediate peptidase
MFRVCSRLPRRKVVLSSLPTIAASRRWCATTSSPSLWKDAFESRTSLESNKKSGLFGRTELATPGGFAVLTESCLDEVRGILREVPSLKGVKLVESFDRLSNAICKIADLAAYVQYTHPDAQFREEASRCSLHLLRLTEELNVNQNLHSYLANVITAQTEFEAMPEQVQRTAQLLMNDFEISGVHLNEEGRERCVSLDQQLQVLKLQILSTFHEPVVLRPRVLPQVLSSFSSVPTTQDGNCVVFYQNDHFHPKVRSRSYEIYYQQSPKRAELTYELLRCRHVLANTIGYSSFAERALRFSSAGTVDRALEFLKKLSDEVRCRAEKEIEVLQYVRNQLDGEGRYTLPNSAKPARPLVFTDIHYLEGEMPRILCCKGAEATGEDIDDSRLTFTVGSVMRGLDQLLQRTFGLRMQPVAVDQGEVWHNSVVKLAIEQHHTNTGDWSLVGHLYCDFFARVNKEGGDSHYTIRCGFNRPSHPAQLPQSVLSINSSPSMPLKISTIRTFFHEFGHGLHSMLGQPEYQHTAGTRCSNDFAEVPSELMEFFCGHEAVLAMLADNGDSAQCSQLAQQLQAREQLFQALELQEQIAVARFDLEVHSQTPSCPEWIETWYHRAQREHASIPVPMDCAPHLRMSHLASYGATYYSYPWAFATAALLWNELFAANPFSLDAGCRYRDAILRHGNSKAPSEMLADLLGKTPDVGDLVSAVVHELDKGNARLQVIWDNRPPPVETKQRETKWVKREGRKRNITEECD